ncbi:iduronate 2-sulfatase-like isoform X2 [Tubulanus polymorphus]|uniref:iduronate 2-sulfatase-like isoform X2 n=1 Tax=Tubulanus polymorphus TaxID=672921 RepID=UPI003DA4E02E
MSYFINKVPPISVVSVVWTLALFLCCHSAESGAPSSGGGGETRPNVLFIAVDDLRPTLGCYGHHKILTPNIDRLASKSVLFNQTFVQQSLCGPSRTSLLTSRRPDTTHLYDFYSYWRKTVGNFTTLPQHFKENGYYTVSIGKIFHHGKCSGKYQDYPYSWSEIPYIPSTMKYKMKKVCTGPHGEKFMNIVCPVDVATQPQQTLPDIQNYKQAIKFFERRHETKDQRPFFLGVGFYKPHIPLKYPKEFLVAWNPWTDLRMRDDVKQLNISFPYGPVPKFYQRLMRQSYYAATSYMDYCVGKVLSALERHGLSDNTIVVFFGDHGWSLGEHGEWSKYSNFEVAVRVPLLISVPGLTTPVNLLKSSRDISKPGIHNFEFKEEKSTGKFVARKIWNKSRKFGFKTSNKLVELVDLFPTLAELANLTVPPLCRLDSVKTIFCTEGSSLVPLLSGKGNILRWKNATFSQYPRPSDLPVENSDKPRLDEITIMGYSMRTVKYRFTEWVSFNHSTFTGNWSKIHAQELYSVQHDPFEDHNLAEKPRFKSVVSQLSFLLQQGWRKSLPVK